MSKENQVLDNVTSQFGMRKFAVKGTHFTINERTTFLRGKHDACVFPLTGHPPMDTAGWMRAFRIARSYGINHYRFHSWCPPDAAFEAADRMGIYLQPELPFWGDQKPVENLIAGLHVRSKAPSEQAGSGAAIFFHTNLYAISEFQSRLRDR